MHAACLFCQHGVQGSGSAGWDLEGCFKSAGRCYIKEQESAACFIDARCRAAKMQIAPHCNHRRTCFSRERVIRNTAKSTVHTPASSRLKPVLQKHRDQLVGPALAGKASVVTPEIYGVPTGLFPAKASPTEAPRSSREDGGGFICAVANPDTHSATPRSAP